MYYNIPFRLNKESVFQILQRSNLPNSSYEDNNEEDNEENKARDIKTKQKKIIIKDMKHERNDESEDKLDKFWNSKLDPNKDEDGIKVNTMKPASDKRMEFKDTIQHKD